MGALKPAKPTQAHAYDFSAAPRIAASQTLGVNLPVVLRHKQYQRQFCFRVIYGQCDEDFAFGGLNFHLGAPNGVRRNGDSGWVDALCFTPCR